MGQGPGAERLRHCLLSVAPLGTQGGKVKSVSNSETSVKGPEMQLRLHGEERGLAQLCGLGRLPGGRGI